MIEFDDRVSMLGMVPQLSLAMMVVEDVFEEFGHDCYIRSITDGKHGKGSSHYRGMAFDAIPIRGPELSAKIRGRMQRRIQARLTPEFQFLDEVDHYHCQWKPQ